MAIISLSNKATAGTGLTEITGTTSIDFEYIFSEPGFLISVVFYSAIGSDFIIRKNGDGSTDLEVNVPAGERVAVAVLMPVYALAKIEFLTITGGPIDYTIYLN